MHHRAPFLCTLLAALLLGAVALPAAGAEPVTARWRFSGIPGEPVNAIAIARDNPQLIYAVTGGDNVPSPYPYINRSTDGGATWERVYEAIQFDHYDVAIDPSDSAVVYVGDSHKLLKTIDGGASWSQLPSIEPAVPTSIAIDPARPRTLYVGINYGWGVYRSTDGGMRYERLLRSVYVNDVTLDPADSAAIYAASEDYVSSGRLITAGGVHRSRDSGARWTKVLTNSAVLTLMVDQRNPRVLYAGTRDDGVLKSVDGGDNWTSASAGLQHRTVHALAMSPRSSQVLYAGTWEGGVYKSRDGGASWSRMNDGLGNLYVLSLAADPRDPTVLYAGTRGGGIYKWSGPPDPGPDELYAHVVDEAGEPIAGAMIYHNGRLLLDEDDMPQRSDAAGNLVLNGVRPGDTLVAAVLQREQPTARAGHQGWAYRVFTTSMQFAADGTPAAVVVNGTTGPQNLVVRSDRPLVLFNLVVSLEWDADPRYVAEVREGMRQASNVLFDMTDGQMAFGAVTIYDRAVGWGDADIQIATANIIRPHAFVGGITSGDRAHVIRLGRGWDGVSGATGSWGGPNGYRTIAHEFGHYGLFLYDEYFGYEELPGGGLGGERPAHCTDTATRAATSLRARASAMANQYEASELSQRGVSGMWSDSCRTTAQFQLNGESGWETLVRRYADTAAVPRWRLTSPVQRGAALAGPEELPAPILDLPQVDVVDDPAAVLDYTLMVVYGPDRQPLRGTMVALQKPNGRVIGQGLTDTAGRLSVYGAAPGDRLRALSFDGALYGQATVGNERTITIELAAVAGKQQTAGHYPHARVVAQPAAGGTVELLIGLEQLGADASPFLGITVPGSAGEATPLLGYAPGNGSYEARISFAATERGTGQLRADWRAGGERPLLQTSYRLQRVLNDRHEEIFSADGHLSLGLAPGSLPSSECYVVVMAPGAVPGELPAGMALVGEAYDVTASGAIAAFEQPAALSLSYDGALANGQGPSGLAIYRWNPATTAWEVIGGQLDAEHQAVSASVKRLGTYALLAPRGAWLAPSYQLGLPLVRR
jgi:photosystem II stability/assembly factor-like uncharacterized protein